MAARTWPAVFVLVLAIRTVSADDCVCNMQRKCMPLQQVLVCRGTLSALMNCERLSDVLRTNVTTVTIPTADEEKLIREIAEFADKHPICFTLISMLVVVLATACATWWVSTKVHRCTPRYAATIVHADVANECGNESDINSDDSDYECGSECDLCSDVDSDDSDDADDIAAVLAEAQKLNVYDGSARARRREQRGHRFL